MASNWTDDDIEGLVKTLGFAVIVGGIVYYLTRPVHIQIPAGAGAGAVQGRPQPATRNRQPRNQADPTGAGAPAGFRATRNQRSSDDDEDGIQTFLKQHTRLPPHHIHAPIESSPDVTRAVSNHHHDGILPFRSTKASVFESKVASRSHNPAENSKCDESNGGGNGADSQILNNRKDRARIFAKLFATQQINPPSRGGTLVVAVPSSDVSSCKLHRILFLLASYYNLFIMVVLDDGDDENCGEDDNEKKHVENYELEKKRMEGIVSLFYENEDVLMEEVLPSHRIVVTQSIASRVAFVRALPKSPDYVIGVDEEEELVVQLTKFGYNAMLRTVTNLLGS